MPTVEADLVELLSKSTDERGRINLGSDYAERDDILVFVLEEPTLQFDISDEVDI